MTTTTRRVLNEPTIPSILRTMIRIPMGTGIRIEHILSTDSKICVVIIII